MIYSFYFEGGSRMGMSCRGTRPTLRQCRLRAGAWIDYTLGGIVGLNFP